MDPEAQQELAQQLETVREALVDEWFEAVAWTCYIPLTPRVLRERLGELLDRVTSLWLAESPFDQDAQSEAEAIGADLASLHFVNAEALGQTLRILGTSLPRYLDTAAPGAASLHSRMASLLERFAMGYHRRGCAMVLDEQEQIRSALVAELQAAEAGLRAARDELEVRVEQRTAELARANAELRESKERWRSLVAQAPDLIGTVDRQGRIRFLNRLPDGSPLQLDLVVGADGPAFAEESHQEALRDTIRQVFEAGVRVTREIEFMSSRGGTTWYAVSFGPIWQDGVVGEVLFVSRNIDQRKKLDQVKDHLIHDVSHELRTPLAKIRMSLELLGEITSRDDPDLERVGRISHLAASSVDSLLATLEGILDLSRLEAGMWTYETAPVSLGDLIDQVITSMGPVAREKGLLLATAVPADLPPIAGDNEKLQRVFINLVDNAVKFSARGTILLSAGYHDGMVHVAIADDGEGILPENSEHVFERFFQEKTRSHGVGIGLAITKAIVDAHGGQIWVESEGRGCGATFHLTFPVMSEEEEP